MKQYRQVCKNPIDKDEKEMGESIYIQFKYYITILGAKICRKIC